jgi:hypothetical protein
LTQNSYIKSPNIISIKERSKLFENANSNSTTSPEQRQESLQSKKSSFQEIRKLFENPLLFQTDLNRINSKAPVSISKDQIQICVSSIVEQNRATTELLNPEIDPEAKEKIKERLSKKALARYVFQNKIDKEMTVEEQKKQIENIENMMIPNPYVVENVEIMEPISPEQIQATKETLEKKDFHFSHHDPNAIYHIMNQIAQDQGLDFVIMDSKKVKRSMIQQKKQQISH